MRTALLAAAVVAVPLAVTPAGAEDGRCVRTTKVLTGRIAGEDGRYVDALLGFDIKDKHGRHLDGRTGSATYGCPGYLGYGKSIRVNRHLPATGATKDGTKDWSVVLPGNTHTVHIEVYPRAAGNGGTDESRYGHALRRSVKVPYGQRVNIRLPLICPEGGTTGTINGWSTDRKGRRIQADRVVAWSLANDNNTMRPIMGWNVGYTKPNGYFAVPNLPSGQTYTVQISRNGVMKQRYGIRVNSCRATYHTAAF